ncbi:MAG TPA: Cys-tRNA(Pro) deacylase [Thermodesulfobacteriota bacterium]|nr:Cys-tRNA(Pro) deacylase [Deltaproteobacteria bacterium]HOC38910.1 Cys-tRNA(Pro) deacylase [Thermodesulfobacteriota bacterium]
MSREKLPVTPGIRFLKKTGVTYSDHLYTYEEYGGTAVSARELRVDEHTVVKTLVMEDDRKKPLIVLMHGDRQVSTKELARRIGVRTIAPCSPDTAEKHTGYKVGGTSPFGTRKQVPVYMEETILDLEKIYINAGHRGYLVGIDPRDLLSLLNPTLVRVAVPAEPKHQLSR